MQSTFVCRLINDVCAARLLGQSAITLRKWRITGQGPKFIKLGQSVRYDLDDLNAFIESRKCGSTSEADKLPGAKRRPPPGTVGRPKKSSLTNSSNALEAV